MKANETYKVDLEHCRITGPNNFHAYGTTMSNSEIIAAELNRLAAECERVKHERDIYKDDFERWDARLKVAHRELACPECGCADEVDAQSQECGCDNPLCERTGEKTLAQEWLDQREALSAAEGQVKGMREALEREVAELGRRMTGSTHYSGCENDHPMCAAMARMKKALAALTLPPPAKQESNNKETL